METIRMLVSDPRRWTKSFFFWRSLGGRGKGGENGKEKRKIGLILPFSSPKKTYSLIEPTILTLSSDFCPSFSSFSRRV